MNLVFVHVLLPCLVTTRSTVKTIENIKVKWFGISLVFI